MSVAVCLLLYGTVVCVLAPRLVPHLTQAGSAPRAAVTVWVMAVASVLASWAVGVSAAVVYVVRTWNRPDPLAMAACLAQVRSVAAGHRGLGMQAALAVLALTLTALLVMLVARVGRHLVTARASSRRHAESARIIGRRVTGVDGLVIDAPQKLAYCLGGRGGTVVITSAAVTALARPHLDAVLAHERAHLAGRHHLLLTVARALTTALPRVRLFAVAEAEIARLLEMCADDTAVRRHGSAPLLSALLTLAGADPIPSTALGASTLDVCVRVGRLADPDPRVRRLGARLLLATITAAAAAAPLLVVWASASGFTPCGPFTA